MARRLLLASTAVLIGLLLPVSEVPAKREKVYRIAGAARDEKGKVVPSDVLSAIEGGVRVSIRYLDAQAAGEALASVVEGASEIFGERKETDRGHLVFAVQIENQGAGDLLYEPGQGRLITDRHDAKFPLDYTELYRLLSGSPAEGPALDDLERAIFSRATTIRRGGSVRKLLVFEGPREGKFKKFEVLVGSLHLPDRDVDPRFPFRRFKVEP